MLQPDLFSAPAVDRRTVEVIGVCNGLRPLHRVTVRQSCGHTWSASMGDPDRVTSRVADYLASTMCDACLRRRALLADIPRNVAPETESEERAA